MQSICCGCHKQVSENVSKNIFEDDLLISTCDCNKSTGFSTKKEHIKLWHGIELFTGYKISRTGNPIYMCDVCFQKVQACMNIRAELFKSLWILTNCKDSENISIPTSKVTLANSTSCNNFNRDSTISMSFERVNTSVEEKESVINDLIGMYKIPDPTIVIDDIINVDENSTSLEFNDLQSDKRDTNNSFASNKLQNDRKNNNSNGTNCLNENSNLYESKENLKKYQENDIESDIDVCSGEDDEILELDIQCRQNEAIEIQSSSESDIEVCDYEPIGKK